MATVQYNNDVDNKPRCIHCGSPAHEGYEVQYIQVDAVSYTHLTLPTKA